MLPVCCSAVLHGSPGSGGPSHQWQYCLCLLLVLLSSTDEQLLCCTHACICLMGKPDSAGHTSLLSSIASPPICSKNGRHRDDACCCFAMYMLVKLQVSCRYTLFIPIYPVGMLAEMVLMAKSLPYLQSQKLNSIALPNAFNFGFDYHLFIQVT